MAVITDVINDALSEIGAALISDPSEPTEQARRANFLYPRVVRTEFRRHAWNFAIARNLVPQTGVPPPFGFKYTYNLPSDCLRVWQVDEYYNDAVLQDYIQGLQVPYVIEARTILTDLDAPLKLRYIRDMQNDIGSWDSMFRDVIAVRLGMKLIPSLVKSESKYERMAQQYKDIIRDAKRVNAIELPPVPIADNAWILGRF